MLRALYDTWTLPSWSEWAARAAPSDLETLTILHIDDHRDLAPPRLIVEGTGWIDPITGKACDLGQPLTVLSALESGALGMGSFLTPFLHLAPNADVRHLCQPPKAQGTVDYDVSLTTVADDLLAPGRLRPAVELVPTTGGVGPGRYRITPNVEDWLVGVRDGPVLLHIDMDYFNNRYDGDSDWQSAPPPLDPPSERMWGIIEGMTDALNRFGLLQRLEDIVIAFSPGFFPAELWAEADMRLSRGLRIAHA